MNYLQKRRKILTPLYLRHLFTIKKGRRERLKGNSQGFCNHLPDPFPGGTYELLRWEKESMLCKKKRLPYFFFSQEVFLQFWFAVY